MSVDYFYHLGAALCAGGIGAISIAMMLIQEKAIARGEADKASLSVAGVGSVLAIVLMGMCFS